MLLSPTMSVADALARGTAFGLAFHPVWALAGVALGTLVLWVAASSRFRWIAALVLTVFAWTMGNASDVAQTAARGVSIAGAATPALPGDTYLGLLVVVWCLVGILVGHIVPLLLGHAVGSRVFRGTGWISALVIGGVTAWLLSLAGGPIGDWLVGLGL